MYLKNVICRSSGRSKAGGGGAVGMFPHKKVDQNI